MPGTVIDPSYGLGPSRFCGCGWSREACAAMGGCRFVGEHAERTLLRTFDMREVRASGDYDLAYCSRCRCNKSGQADVVNPITEACENPECPCHQEEA